MENRHGNGVAMETTGEENSAHTSAENSVAMASEDSTTSSEAGGSKYSLPLPPSRESVNILSAPLSEERMGWVAETMKVVFNQTVHWKEAGQFTEVRGQIGTCINKDTRTPH